MFSLFSKKEDTPVFNWKNIIDQAELRELISNSAFSRTPILFFKHSSRCGISRMVLSRFEKKYAQSLAEIPCYLINVIEQRDLSNFLSSHFDIIHESPQLLFVSGDKCIANGSHNTILNLELEALSL